MRLMPSSTQPARGNLPAGWTIEHRQEAQGLRWELMGGTTHRGMFMYQDQAVSAAPRLVTVDQAAVDA